MKKKKGILIVLLLLISIGFAYLSTNLYINGTSLVKANTWKVYFDNITESSNILINKNATISSDKKSVDFEFTFEKPGDEYHFYVDVVNAGTLDAMLDLYEVTGLTTDQDKYIDWTVTYADETNLNRYDLLKSKNKDTLLVKVKYIEDVNYDDLPKDSDISINLKFKAVYVQADSNFQVERNRKQYLINYNLDGGTISNNPTTYYQGDRVVIPNPTKEGYTFAGWTVGKNLFNPLDYYEAGKENGIGIEETDIIQNHVAYQENVSRVYLDFKENTQYTFQYDWEIEKIYGGAPYIESGIATFDKDNNRLSESYYIKGTYEGQSGSMTMTSDKDKTVSYYASAGWGYYGSLRFSYIQLEEGDTATAYEPYISTPTKDIVIPVGANGNRTYVANWIAN